MSMKSLYKGKLTNRQGYMLDMDGTFYVGGNLLPGALEILDFFNQQKMPFSFLTNNTSRSKNAYERKLIELGVNKRDARIYTAGDATITFIKSHYPEAQIYLMGTQSLRESFFEAGLPLVNKNPELVVLGYDTELTYAGLKRFCDFVRGGVPYIATHPDINCPVEGGFAPDIGAMMALIEASTGRKADLIIGKPNQTIVKELAEQWGMSSDQLVMVGDRLYTDIALGETAGVTTVLVLSGETKREDLAESPFQPNFVFENLEALLSVLKANSRA